MNFDYCLFQNRRLFDVLPFGEPSSSGGARHTLRRLLFLHAGGVLTSFQEAAAPGRSPETRAPSGPRL
ncbi:MAG TPA: hypothetical protein VKE72_03460 [Methylocella sp.]|nr:hypothetical protein [Methylocella sp.]